MFVVCHLNVRAETQVEHGTLPHKAVNELETNIQKSESVSRLKEVTPPTCDFEDTGEEWVDEFRGNTHRRLCRTARWIDSKFGDAEKFSDVGFTGKVAIGLRHDSKEGFDPTLRIKVNTKLPNVSKRMSAFIGRVEEDSYVSNTEAQKDALDNVGLRSNDDQDAEWLVGLGYRIKKHRNTGFDYSLGAKISRGLNPYAKVTHRYRFEPSDSTLWRTTQTAFWRSDERFGVSSSLDFTHIIDHNDIFEWNTNAKYTQESEQWEWISGPTWHHSFSDKKGISSRIYMRGEQGNEVKIPEYGVTFNYIQPFLRPWINLQTGIDFRWERESVNRSYDPEVRFGVRIEMLLGDYYNRNGR